MKNCKHCNTLLANPKNTFCDCSCSAKFNNKGVRRHGNPKSICRRCGELTSISTAKYCSYVCAGVAKRIPRTVEEIRAGRNEMSARYRALLRNQTVRVDLPAIKEFYKHCPTGYEVDHIIPISKGGLHSIENLQYLTVTENRSKGSKILVL